METLYKVLNEDGTPCHGGSGQWNLHGKWMPFIQKLHPCKSGYHLCRRGDLVVWLGPVIWTAKYRGERLDCEDKIVVQQARIIKRLHTWNERTARLFACDCAEHVDGYNQIIAVARDYANGKAIRAELAAALNADWNVVRAATRAAGSAASHAWDAAREAARAAARAATWNVALTTERLWQTERLFAYLDGEEK